MMPADEFEEPGDASPSPGSEPPPIAIPVRRTTSGMSTEEAATHSVYNELNIFPGRPNEVIQSDWRCSECGYNLRGTMTGNRCPECGSIELYRPPPPGEVSFKSWYEERRKSATNAKFVSILFALFFVTGLFAVIGTFLSQIMPASFGMIVVGPTMAEILKIALILLIVETRPYYIRREVELTYLAIAAALGFALVSNLIHLNVLSANPTYAQAMWRWSVCTLLHVACTVIASGGVVAAWRAADEQKRAPTMRLLINPLAIAIAIHGGYNAIAILADFAEFAY